MVPGYMKIKFIYPVCFHGAKICTLLTDDIKIKKNKTKKNSLSLHRIDLQPHKEII